MIRNLEGQKTKLKERLMKEIDEYYEKLENSSNEEGFDINKIEELMIENERKIKKVLERTNGEITSNIEVEVKKNAQSAERR